MPDRDRKTNMSHDAFWRRLSLSLMIAAAAVVAGLLVYLFLTPNVEVRQSRVDIGASRVTDYSLREIADDDTPLGVKKEYRFTLDDVVEKDIHLAFYTVHQYVEVYLDGELLYSLKPAGENRIGKTVGSNWTMLPLYREDAGKEVRVEIIPVYESFRDREVEFLLGSQLSIFTDRLRRDLPQLILGVITVFVGLVFLCVSAYQFFTQRKRGWSPAALGLFAVMMGVWRLTDTRFTPFIFPNRPVFLFYASLAMLMLGMLPLIRSEEARRRDRRPLDGLCIALALLCLIQMLLQLTGTMDLRESLTATHIAIVATAVLLVGTAARERVKYPLEPREQLWEKLPLLFLAGVVADAAAFYVRKTSSGLIFSLSALLLYTMFMGISIMFHYGRQEKLLLEREAELEKSKVAITLSQIQPHFLYNSLSAISDLCHDSPEAMKAIDDFAIYLRGNMDSLTCKGLIRFSQELQHIETYLRLEQLRFGDMLCIVYDIQEEDFLLPPLTVQPLVENAVKHGVCQKREGGTVTLRTRRRGDAVIITVEDDGVGFDPARPCRADGRSHVGIQNVRSRLRQMAGGTLEVRSAPGAGTTATVTLYPNHETARGA